MRRPPRVVYAQRAVTFFCRNLRPAMAQRDDIFDGMCKRIFAQTVLRQSGRRVVLRNVRVDLQKRNDVRVIDCD